MKLKTYVARDPQEALAQVKRELGPEAVILSAQSRRVRTSESSWAKHRQVEITAAVDQAAALDSPTVFQAWPANSANPSLPFRQLREELQEMKGLLRQWLGTQDPPSWLAPYRDLNTLFQILVRVGIHDQIIHRWLDGVRTSLANGNNSGTNLKGLALRQLLQEIEVINP
ncbi:MAG: hypothetical protein P8X58_15395, partial [Syntrophobacterales bacterium]